MDMPEISKSLAILLVLTIAEPRNVSGRSLLVITAVVAAIRSGRLSRRVAGTGADDPLSIESECQYSAEQGQRYVDINGVELFGQYNHVNKTGPLAAGRCWDQAAARSKARVSACRGCCSGVSMKSIGMALSSTVA
jgi:hypothetical protein